MPLWEPRNLQRHHRDRLRKDAGCFEDLLGINGRTMSASEYELRSQDAVANAWGKYEGQSWDSQQRRYRETAIYFVDDQLVVAITDSFEHEFITCFHEHFDYPHGLVPGLTATPGEQVFRYRERVKFDEQGGLIRNVKWIPRD
jgi:hypothetical protein